MQMFKENQIVRDLTKSERNEVRAQNFMNNVIANNHWPREFAVTQVHLVDTGVRGGDLHDLTCVLLLSEWEV